MAEMLIGVRQTAAFGHLTATRKVPAALAPGA
jgi:hypothetical protein